MEEKVVYLSEMTEEDFSAIEGLYIMSFPKEERKPFSMLFEFRAQKKAELLVARDQKNDELVGLVFVLLHGDKVLLDYLAIMPECQNKGYGGSTIRAISNRYRKKSVIGEIESVDMPTDNQEQRMRRLDFYLKNGMCRSGLVVNLFGCEFELIYLSDRKVTFEEYKDFLVYIFGKKELVDNNVKFLRQVEI